MLNALYGGGQGYLVRHKYACGYDGEQSLMQIAAIRALGCYAPRCSTVLGQAGHCFPEGSNHKCTVHTVCPFLLPFSLPNALVTSQLQTSREQIFGCLHLPVLLVKHLGKPAIPCSSLKCRRDPNVFYKWYFNSQFIPSNLRSSGGILKLKLWHFTFVPIIQSKPSSSSPSLTHYWGAASPA